MRAIISVDKLDSGEVEFSVDDGYDGDVCPNTIKDVESWVSELENSGDYFYLVIDESEKTFLKQLSKKYSIFGIDDPWVE